MPENGPVVRTDSLSKQFGSLTVLRSVSLQVRSRESLTIFGRNGAGKTTLLRIIAGLTRTFRGDVHVFGQSVKKGGEAVRSKIGFVSHDTLLYPDLTAHDNLVFYARLYRLDEPAAAAARLLEQLGLESKSATSVRALSRGMKQRLSLGRAFLHSPRLLLLDEPFTGLDEAAIDTLDAMLAGFRQGGGSILMTSHNLELGWRRANTVAVLDRGGITYTAATAATDIDSFKTRYREIITH